jgi:hypothetical protein
MSWISRLRRGNSRIWNPASNIWKFIAFVNYSSLCYLQVHRTGWHKLGEAEGNRTIGRKFEASTFVIPTIHGLSFLALSILFSTLQSILVHRPICHNMNYFELKYIIHAISIPTSLNNDDGSWIVNATYRQIGLTAAVSLFEAYIFVMSIHYLCCIFFEHTELIWSQTNAKIICKYVLIPLNTGLVICHLTFP